MRPRERLADAGEASLCDAELVAILLCTGSPAVSVEELASRVVNRFGGRAGLAVVGQGELCSLPGLGPAKAGRLLAARELGRRLAATPLKRGRGISSSADIYRALAPRLRHLEHELVLAIALDTHRRVLSELEVAVGGLSACGLEPADLFRRLIRRAASAFVLIHNHPSGRSEPSASDAALTERLSRAGALLGIPLLDHIVIGEQNYFSFLDAGLLAAP